MKHTLCLSLIMLMGMVVTSCGSRSGVLEGVPVKVVWEEGWCEADASGRLHYSGEFSGRISPTVNGCFWAEDSMGMVTVYRATNPARPIGMLQGLRSAGYYSEGVIPVFTSDGVLRVCDGFGRERFHLSEIGGSQVVACSAMYADGMLSVGNANGLWGAVDREGNLQVGARYAAEFMFKDGCAEVVVRRGARGEETYSTHIIDKSGREIGERNTPAGMTVVSANDTYIIYSNSDGHRGLAKKNGEVVLAPRYNSLEFGSGNLLLASNAQRYFLIDVHGNVVSDFDNADEVIPICHWGAGRENGFGYAVRIGALWALYDRTGQRTGAFDYVAIGREVLVGPEPIQSAGLSPMHTDPGWNDALLSEPMEFEADSIYAVPDSLVFE